MVLWFQAWNQKLPVAQRAAEQIHWWDDGKFIDGLAVQEFPAHQTVPFLENSWRSALVKASVSRLGHWLQWEWSRAGVGSTGIPHFPGWEGSHLTTSFLSFCLALLEFSLSSLSKHEPQHLDEGELWNGSGEEMMGKDKMQWVVTKLYLLIF